MRQEVELLAPAGDMQCLKAAIHAGADAVYVGGSKFGARAYAHNFQEQELCDAIDYVHMFGKKIYLTLNTLLKDEEIQEVAEYVRPFYETGLDGVIVQDFGVVEVLKAHFPDLEIHASTQMTVTGSYGALELKKMGICRVVPARELSLGEIREIVQGANVEVEVFIHGAMCYSYSGQCLFSSFLGGRSGNRGKCAGPCRLPYDIVDENGKKINSEKEQYPLSLKDLGVLEILPELMESGIASFKIEGRMKSPEYVAGVTGIYRKYMDRYVTDKEHFTIDEQDLYHLKNLYTRGTMETGYYQRHNGREMVTLSKGSYENAVSPYTEEIKARYVDKEKKISLTGKAIFLLDKPGTLEVCVTEGDETEERKHKVKAYTSLEVMAAKNRPMEEEDLRRQLLKTGNSAFTLEKLDIEKDSAIFIPNKELNELRRSALEQLKENMLERYRRTYCPPLEREGVIQVEEDSLGGHLSVSVTTRQQWNALLQSEFCDRIKNVYIPYRLYQVLWQEDRETLRQCRRAGMTLYMSFPAVVRAGERKRIQAVLESGHHMEILDEVDGFLVNNLEIFAFLKESVKQYKKPIAFQADYGMYSFNKEACSFLREMGVEYMTVPFEWSKHEINDFVKKVPGQNREWIVYGYIPLMESANCIYKTMNRCKKQGDTKLLYLKDRYKTCFPVLADCVECRNTIFNSVPLSMHNSWSGLSAFDHLDYRLHFTVEDGERTKQVIRQFGNLIFSGIVSGKGEENSFTTGHYRKGVL